jgi:uncharacterized membrane protein
MKYRPYAFLCVIFLAFLLLAFACKAQAQTDVIQYQIQVNTDGSADWAVTQVTGINATIDTWDGFQQRILLVIGEAASLTYREMAVNTSSFDMGTIYHQDSQSKTTEYKFTWQNFTKAEDGKIAFGDVFQVDNFFGQLYKDGALKIVYSQAFALESVSPTPNQRDDIAHSLEWFGTQFFMSGKPSITLTSSSATPSSTPSQPADSVVWQMYALIGVVFAVATVLFASVYVAKRRGYKANRIRVTSKLPSGPAFESEEEKIVKIIHSSGGSVYQSAITDQTRFSKAKTSQLLTGLEKKGVVTRYKRGRDKIVTLAERGKGEP